ERDLRGGPRATIDGAREFDIALARGEWARAAEWFFATPHSATRRTVGAAAKVRLGELLARNGHPHAALAAFQRALADHPVDDSRPAAHLGAAQVLLDDLANPTGAYQHLYEVLDGGATPDQETTARRLLERLASSLRNLPRGPRR
ncbi:MAG TPA: hypothetical protein VD788_13500, partial [Candidatus Polarisedimenticolaceae bacterium]|nr:hypothetical protein [Candidatus Polarisedimenticolaceae bacterium]